MERVADKVEKEKERRGKEMAESGKKTAVPLQGLFGV